MTTLTSSDDESQTDESEVLTTDESALHADSFDGIADAVESAVVGKRSVVRLALVAMLAGGHLLLEDVPGVGKTTLARAIASCVRGDVGRIQFTPDLLPSDVTGVTVFNQGTREFDFHPGPVFSNIVIADEINRASPKTQSALLEVMEEQAVTVDGVRHAVASPFLVVATQNPVEMDGTYRLPEAQLDRFLMRLSLGHADPTSELAIIRGNRLTTPEDVPARTDPEGMDEIAAASRRVHVEDSLYEYVVRIATATRSHPELTVGLSTRATVAMANVMRVQALSVGRSFVTPDDVKDLVLPVWAHRLILSPEASVGGRSGADILQELLRTVPAPQPRLSQAAGG
ncbi:MoxR family ATPase [Spiractinospora alimapuensis]|uniref:AAA family ATPase n=1 Tax=Spiractinospora alimapuensis TaxID=2820884 RepID=UPI001F1DF7FA|nr:MoxR family ATPase [Spiractinospora alimapuensis]QVQ53878.1 MoxR family ATPase [Spiractinospora alimapuensis]